MLREQITCSLYPNIRIVAVESFHMENKGITTFFYLDKQYRESLSKRNTGLGRFHSTRPKNWILVRKAYDSSDWFTPKWTKVPEGAMGVSERGFKNILKDSGLKVADYYPGNWKEIPGLYFQDVFVLEQGILNG